MYIHSILLLLFVICTCYYIFYLIFQQEKILFLDIDDTLLTAEGIFIYFKKRITHKRSIKLTPCEYKKYALKYSKEHFNFSDFDDPYLIKKSILNSKPLRHNLNIIKKHIDKGWKIGILTARGEEKTIKQILPLWLKQELDKNIMIDLENIHAVGDIYKNYPGKNDSDKKLKVLLGYRKKEIYDRIKLIDDNKSTIDLIKKHGFEYIHC